MSTTTINLGLVKPEYTDTADVHVINQNMDKIDGATGGVMGSLAIIANGNIHAAIASGQYVYVRGHSTLAEGLYTAKAAIAVNDTLSLSNLAAVSNGGLNALLGKIPEQLIHIGTETDYPLSAAHTEYPMGITLIYTLSSTSYPYGTGTVVTIRSAAARCVQFSFGNTSNSYKLRTADSNGWSAWKTYTGS